MKKTKYDEATRAAFGKAALEARNGGKPWSEIFSAAESAGYQGTVGGIKQFLVKFTEKPKADLPESAPVSEAVPAVESEAKPEQKAKKPAKTQKIKNVKKATAPAPVEQATKRTRIIYDAATKKAILDSVDEARKIGGWNQALESAQKAGYKGGLSGLMQFVTNQTGTTKKKQPIAPAAKVSTKVKTKATVATAPKSQTKPKASPLPHSAPTGGFELQSLPEALRGDFSDLLRSKIEKEFDHSIKDKNFDQATAMYLEICEVQKVLDAKVKALKSL